MKTFTERERTAAFDEISSLTIGEMGQMTSTEIVDVVLNAVDKAEGHPVGSGDKYLDARDEIKQCLKELNKAIDDAHSLGLQISIEKDLGPPIAPSIPMPIGWAPPPQPCPKFRLFKLTKDFDIA